MLVEVDHGQGLVDTPWSFKVEGKLLNEMSEE